MYQYVSSFFYAKVMDALFAKARHYSAIGDVENAYKAYDFILTREKTSTTRKIDATMEKSRVAFFAGVSDPHTIKIFCGSLSYFRILASKKVSLLRQKS
jgi:hypothetical protein